MLHLSVEYILINFDQAFKTSFWHHLTGSLCYFDGFLVRF